MPTSATVRSQPQTYRRGALHAPASGDAPPLPALDLNMPAGSQFRTHRRGALHAPVGGDAPPLPAALALDTPVGSQSQIHRRGALHAPAEPQSQIYGRGAPCAPFETCHEQRKRSFIIRFSNHSFSILLACTGIILFVHAALANTSASNSGVLVSAPQLNSDCVTITATNTSDKNINFSAKVSYTYESLTGDRVSGEKTISETLDAGQSDASAGSITERRIQVDKVTIFSISSF